MVCMANLDPFDAHRSSGKARFQAGDWASAAGWYTQAIEAGDCSATAFANRSAALAALCSWQESLVDAERAVQLQPSYVKAYYRMGTALLQLGRPSEALAAFQSGLLLSPGSQQLQRGVAEAEAAERQWFRAQRQRDSEVVRSERTEVVQQRAGDEELRQQQRRDRLQQRQAQAAARMRQTTEAKEAHSRLYATSPSGGQHHALPQSSYYHHQHQHHQQQQGRPAGQAAGATQSSLYSVLGVCPGARADGIRRAYLKAIAVAHPDKGGTQESFAAIQAAYHVLSDVRTRAEYDDRKGAVAERHKPVAPATSTPTAGPDTAANCNVYLGEDEYAQLQHGLAVEAHARALAASQRGDDNAVVEAATQAISHLCGSLDGLLQWTSVAIKNICRSQLVMAAALEPAHSACSSQLSAESLSRPTRLRIVCPAWSSPDESEAECSSPSTPRQLITTPSPCLLTPQLFARPAPRRTSSQLDLAAAADWIAQGRTPGKRATSLPAFGLAQPDLSSPPAKRSRYAYEPCIQQRSHSVVQQEMLRLSMGAHSAQRAAACKVNLPTARQL
ncbi:hypothetical protein WJX72_006003 [[Myrmecia] bisecta]|uniref:J domain-containing protein n=1 Tax=[Myrmecia] bisecta TaxID=41462 RepID=A0AAW1R7U9_9CHLO